jgi:hypothetical protein
MAMVSEEFGLKMHRKNAGFQRNMTSFVLLVTKGKKRLPIHKR